MEVEDLGDAVIHLILSKLSPRDLAVVGCVSPRLRVWASDDSLWSSFCSQDLNLYAPLDPLSNLTPSFKVLISKAFYHLVSSHLPYIVAPCFSFYLLIYFASSSSSTYSLQIINRKEFLHFYVSTFINMYWILENIVSFSWP